jgi:hypothetical protein
LIRSIPDLLSGVFRYPSSNSNICALAIVQCIQSELPERLKNGCYSKIHNYPFIDFDYIVKLDEDRDVHVLEDEEVSNVVTISL